LVPKAYTLDPATYRDGTGGPRSYLLIVGRCAIFLAAHQRLV